MSESKTLKTRLALLYKTYTEWEAVKDTFVPLKGEVCFCDVPAGAGIIANEPCLMFKVGNGTSTFAQLNWASGLAADVYTWAKKNNLDFTDLSTTFLEKLEEFIREHSTAGTKVFNVANYGFNTNLRENQVVEGSALIDAVLDAYATKSQVVVIKAGEYRFSVVETIDNSEGGDATIGFACVGSMVDTSTELETATAYSEKLAFVYSPLVAKTYSIYGTDKSHVTKTELATQVAALDTKINGKADTEIVTAIAETVLQLSENIGLIQTDVTILNNVNQCEVELGNGFFSAQSGPVKYSINQNDFRIYLPEDLYATIPHETLDQIKGNLCFYPLNSNAAYYKIGNYENYDEEFWPERFFELMVDDSGRKFANYAYVTANWDATNNTWKLITSEVTDTHYPNYGTLVEFYDTNKNYLFACNYRVVFSDWDHFYNNKDWYSVEGSTGQADNTTIVYNANEKLAIKGYAAAEQGMVPTMDESAGIVWKTPLSQEALDAAVAMAQQNATTAGNYATTAGNKAIESATSATASANSAALAERQVEVIQEWIADKFWWGSIDEYNALTSLTNGTFYFVKL